jgi:glycine betaine/proline transport system permease protein
VATSAVPLVTAPTTTASDAGARWRRYVLPATVVVGLAVVAFVVGKEPPTWLDAHVKPAVDRAYAWIVRNRQSFWLLSKVFTPIGHFLDHVTKSVLSGLRFLRWPGVLALAAAIGARTGVRRAVIGVLALGMCGLLGFWDHTLITLSLMIVSVAVALLIGIPLGVWAGLSDRVDRALRSFLDAAQVMPAYVYLLPAVVLFGIANPAAVVATMIFAVPPAVRLTSHGIRSVPVVANEVGESFGCTKRQLLFKVQLPMARRTIMLGLNQVIMMAFGVVVIAALVGTGGVGNDVLQALQKVSVGPAFQAGVVLVFAAMALDRITTGERIVSRRRPRVAVPAAVKDHPLVAALLFVGGVVLIARLAGVHDFPSNWKINITNSVNHGANYVKAHFRDGVPVVGGTESFSNFVVIHLLTPLRDLLVNAPWLLIVAVVVAIAWVSGGPRLAAICGLCLVALASLRDWDLAMDTLSQVLVALALSLLLAIPIGIIAGRSDRFERLIRPVLDFAQVMPTFSYLVPIIFLFNVGRVPGVIAAVIYAIPPGIRLTSLGLRQVPVAPREAATSFGATKRQELVKVQLPLAARSIMLGINQVVMMVLSMVIVAALVGAGALGLEALYGLTKKLIGQGVAGGLSIVLLAVVLDRITQAWGHRPAARPTVRDVNSSNSSTQPAIT